MPPARPAAPPWREAGRSNSTEAAGPPAAAPPRPGRAAGIERPGPARATAATNERPSVGPPPAPPASRVIKTMPPHAPGARRWARAHGDALVCVRYRIDPATGQRLTTVEIVVDGALAQAQLPVGVRVAWEEVELRRAVKAAGGRWDAQAGVWRLPLGAARRLGLAGRIVRERGAGDTTG